MPKILDRHRNWVRTVVMTPDGKQVRCVAIAPNNFQVVSGSGDRTVKIWDLTTAKEVRTLTGHKNWVNRVAVTPNDSRILSGSRDQTVKVWDFATGENIITFTGHSDYVNVVRVIPNSSWVVSGSRDHTLKVWDFTTGEELITFSGDSAFYGCGVCPDGRTIIAGDSSGVIHFLRLEL